jgi:ribosome-associated heat shock protein Hsp15
LAGSGRQGEVQAGQQPVASRQRLDKWLWFARIVKSRTLAAKLVSDGHVRVNSTRIDTPAKAVGPGDVLTVSLPQDVKVLKILASGSRRGPFEEARLLYKDLSPPPQAGDGAILMPKREAGAGRPTKRDRRVLGLWLGRE